MKGHLLNLWRWIAASSDLILCIVLVAFGLWLLNGQHYILVGQDQRPDSTAAATLVGALFGGAAVLLGNWINRYNEQRRAATDLEQRREKLKTPLSAELVSVAAALINAKHFVDAAAISLQAGGVVGEQANLTWVMPPGMPFTDGLGIELMILDQPAIDALVTLRSNLAITRASMEAITEGRELFGFLRIAALSRGLGHDMEVLAEAFEHIAPGQRLAIDRQPPELAASMLRRKAGAVEVARPEVAQAFLSSTAGANGNALGETPRV
ncbi:MAG: hypothetical protein ACLPXB_03765 [Thiobacillaceae bacterium]